ncbi:hypothetical protein FQZ97_1226700 [compost metagenome]
MAASTSGAMSAEAAVPPLPASSDVSCAVMACTGFVEVMMAAPWGALLAFMMATGSQMNFTLPCSGIEASHRRAQWGHCGSNKT